MIARRTILVCLMSLLLAGWTASVDAACLSALIENNSTCDAVVTISTNLRDYGPVTILAGNDYEQFFVSDVECVLCITVNGTAVAQPPPVDCTPVNSVCGQELCLTANPCVWEIR